MSLLASLSRGSAIASVGGTEKLLCLGALLVGQPIRDRRGTVQ